MRAPAFLFFLSAIAPGAFAQDSVAPPDSGGLSGDAIDAYRAGASSEQVNDYVLDLAVLRSSWGNRFAIGPAAKSSRGAAAAVPNHLLAAQSLAPAFRTGLLRRPMYASWRGVGPGVNASVNSTPTGLPGGGLLGQGTAGAFAEFGAGPDAVFGTGDDEQNIVSLRIDFQARRPNRLYVSRVLAAQNKPASTGGNSATASLGLGGVDAGGVIAFPADGFGVLSPARLQGRTWNRVDPAARDPARVNALQQTGAGDPSATTRLLDVATALTPPSVLSGSPARTFGLSLASDLWAETAPGIMTSTRAHLGAGDSARSMLHLLGTPYAPISDGAATGTGLFLTRAAGDERTRSVTVIGVRPDGTVSGRRLMTLPTVPGEFADPADGYDPTIEFPDLESYEFSHTQSQALFRGGAPLAGAVRVSGELVVAAPVQVGVPEVRGSSVPQDDRILLAVATLPTDGGPARWEIAAHAGKALRGDAGADGIPGTMDADEGDGVLDATPVGHLVLARDAGVSPGPSCSAAAMDSDGNLYFLAFAELNGVGGQRTSPVLVRANRDAETSAYTLELLIESGSILHGPNSTLAYRVTLPGIADADSVASGSIWAGACTQGRIEGVGPGALATGSALSLGMLAFRATIVYDVDSDGAFVDPEHAKTPTADQAYRAMMLIMPAIPAADFDRSGSVTSQDFFEFLGAFFSGTARADYNGTGAADSQDFFDFLADFFGA